MSEHPYDVVVIGAGPGGYVAAIRAAQLGLRVAIVEKENLGGVCLNWGCIPTKALLRNAEVISFLGRGKEFGFSVSNVTLDYQAAVERSRTVSARLVKGVDSLMRKNHVEVIGGSGKLLAPSTVQVALNDGSTRTLQTRNVIVATGGSPRTIPGIEPDGDRVMTSREAIVLRDVPSSVVIIGAGPIVMEFAHIWQAYGAQVTVVKRVSCEERPVVFSRFGVLFQQVPHPLLAVRSLWRVESHVAGLAESVLLNDWHGWLLSDLIQHPCNPIPPVHHERLQRHGVDADGDVDGF